jgi:predicted DNA-binding protein (MmcQ/YjbR family)
LKVGGKTFAYFNTSEPEQWRFSIRVSADRFVELTDRLGVNPAKDIGRSRWITIVNVAEFHEDYLHELILAAYETALASLSMKRRQEITA